MRKIDGFLDLRDAAGNCGIEHVELEKPRRRPKRGAADIRAKAAASHAQYDRVGKSCRLDFLNKTRKSLEMPKHRMRNPQPTQRITDHRLMRGIILPQRWVAVPEPLRKLLLLEPVKGGVHGGAKAARFRDCTRLWMPKPGLARASRQCC